MKIRVIIIQPSWTLVLLLRNHVFGPVSVLDVYWEVIRWVDGIHFLPDGCCPIFGLVRRPLISWAARSVPATEPRERRCHVAR